MVIFNSYFDITRGYIYILMVIILKSPSRMVARTLFLWLSTDLGVEEKFGIQNSHQMTGILMINLEIWGYPQLWMAPNVHGFRSTMKNCCFRSLLVSTHIFVDDIPVVCCYPRSPLLLVESLCLLITVYTSDSLVSSFLHLCSIPSFASPCLT